MQLFKALILLLVITACSEQPQEVAEVSPEATAANSEQVAIENAAEPAGPQIDKSDPNWKSKVTEPDMMNFEAGSKYIWELDTNQGVMTFELYHEQSPKHVNSTIYLTELGFYDDVLFHRVIPGFMAQGGDPTGTGGGGPAYKYDGEFSANLSHTKPGLLSMANAGPGTDGSQFFITFVPTPFLDGKHTIFGEMTSGMDVLRALEARGTRGGRTTEVLKINQASIRIE